MIWLQTMINVHFRRHYIAFRSCQSSKNNEQRNQLHDGNKANSWDVGVKLCFVAIVVMKISPLPRSWCIWTRNVDDMREPF